MEAHMLLRLILFCLLTTIPLSLRAESLAALEGRYKVAPSSVIHFSVAQMGGQAIEGRFKSFSGQFVLGGEDASRSSVQFTLSPGSVQAVDPRVEEFIKSEAVFDVVNYPKVSFRSTAVKRTGDDTAIITGRLTAKGVTRDTKFSIRYEGKSGGGLKFHVTGKMSRALFKMDVGTPVYSNMVVLDMDLVGKRN
jgi:polyisoprenoid-binding protein YceI